MRFSYCRWFFLLAFCPIYIETSGKCHTTSCWKQNLTATIFLTMFRIERNLKPACGTYNKKNCKHHLLDLAEVKKMRPHSHFGRFMFSNCCMSLEKQHKFKCVQFNAVPAKNTINIL